MNNRQIKKALKKRGINTGSIKRAFVVNEDGDAYYCCTPAAKLVKKIINGSPMFLLWDGGCMVNWNLISGWDLGGGFWLLSFDRDINEADCSRFYIVDITNGDMVSGWYGSYWPNKFKKWPETLEEAIEMAGSEINGLPRYRKKVA